MFEFKLPDLGEGIAEGEILKWHVQPGDVIREDDPLVEVETDKATMFEPFVSARRGSHGLGLGLSMSRRFLERIGGGLRIKSKGGYTAALLVVPLERELPKIRLEDSTWAGRRAEQRS